MQNRIGELVAETNDAKLQFKELHKSRVKLEKDRDVVRESITGLADRCSNLQMLKFGKVMDIDQLEAGTDKTKEREAQEGVKEVEKKHSNDVNQLTQELEALRDDLCQVKETACIVTIGILIYILVDDQEEYRVTAGGGAAD